MTSDYAAHNAEWIDQQGGRATCTKHGGTYLAAAVADDPRASSHVTPLAVWVRVTPSDIHDHIEADLVLECETCANQAGRSTAHKVRR